MTEFYNPYDPAVHADPYPAYQRMRDHAPAYHNEELDFWALTRHADVLAGYHDFTRLSNRNGNSIESAAWGPNAYRYASVLGVDSPAHARLRAPLNREFNRRVAAVEPAARALVRERLDAALANDELDLITDFAATFPADVLSIVVGVPEADRPLVRHCAERLVARDEGAHDLPIVTLEATLEFERYCADLVAQRRKEPGNDFVSAVITRPDVTDEEVVSFLNLLAAAANDTIIQLIGNAWYWAWRWPRQRELAFAGNVVAWVEETLRFDSPNQYAARLAAVDIPLHGAVIPAGAKVLLIQGAANRDPTVFDDPDRYDLTRDTSQMISFGAGRHFCIGARLTRLQARVALEELVRLVADYDVDEAGARTVVMAEARGFAALPITVRRR